MPGFVPGDTSTKSILPLTPVLTHAPSCPASLPHSASKDSSPRTPVCPSQGGVHLRMAPLLTTVRPCQSRENSLPGRRRHTCRMRQRNLDKATSILLRLQRSLDPPCQEPLFCSIGTVCHLSVLLVWAPGSCVCHVL